MKTLKVETSISSIRSSKVKLHIKTKKKSTKTFKKINTKIKRMTFTARRVNKKITNSKQKISQNNVPTQTRMVKLTIGQKILPENRKKEPRKDKVSLKRSIWKISTGDKTNKNMKKLLVTVSSVLLSAIAISLKPITKEELKKKQIIKNGNQRRIQCFIRITEKLQKIIFGLNQCFTDIIHS